MSTRLTIPSPLVFALLAAVLHTDAAPAAERPPAQPASLMATPAWTWEADRPGAQLGNGFTSVSTIGDVNGDGFSDYAVGAPNWSHGEADEGAVFLFAGTSAVVGPQLEWKFEPDVANSYLGATVAPAGDVNGDGYADLVVGAPGLTQDFAGEGKVFVFLGSPSGLATTPAWSATGGQAGANFGTCVATAGDVDGDGYDDVIVGANGFDDGLFDRGKAYVYRGGPGGLAGSPAWTFEGPGQGDGFGWSVATAGDVNGDGYADVIVGAPFTTVNDWYAAGAAYVFTGSAGGVSTAPLWTLTGPIQWGAQFGFSVAGIGDTDGDGYADFAVGAPGYSESQSNQGQVSVYAGRAAGGPLGFWVQPGPLSVIDHGAQYGYSVATAGDVNGDGYADLLVGAPSFSTGNPAGYEKGLVSLYEGGPAGPPPVPTWSAPGQDLERFGQCVATAGDPNADGFADIVAGAPGHSNGEANEGAAYLFKGFANLPPTTPSWSFNRATPDTSWFSARLSLGDIDGDGYDDLVILRATTLVWATTPPEQLEVLRGGPAGLSAAPDQTIVEAPGEHDAWVRCIQDVNGDGYDDVALNVGDMLGDPTPHYRILRVLPGGPAGVTTVPVWSHAYPTDGTRPVDGAGADVNGDGLLDLVVLVSAPGSCSTCFDSHLDTYLGTPSGLSPSASSTDPIQGDSNTALSLISVGDFDGDGRGDVVMGDINYSGAFTGEGGAWLYSGASTGLVPTPSQTFMGGAANTHLGRLSALGDANGDGYGDFGIQRDGVIPKAVEVHYGNAALPMQTLTGSGNFGRGGASAGDVNGDGYSDAFIGSQLPPVGRISLFLGGPNGLQMPPDWTVSGASSSESFSTLLAADGDVNGDGFSDMVHMLGPVPFQGVEAYYGNGGQGLDRAPQQLRADGSAPIGLLGRSGDPNAFEVRARGRSAAGRTRVRLQSEARAWGAPFDLAGLQSAPWTALDAPLPGSGTSTFPLSLYHGSLPSFAAEKWRARIASASPYFPWTPWLSPQGNGREQHDLRLVPLAQQGLSVPLATVGGLQFASPLPNPARGATTLRFALPAAARVSLDVFDLGGRRVAALVDGPLEAGPHSVSWDGQLATGQRAADGIYFARLVTPNGSLARKLVRIH